MAFTPIPNAARIQLVHQTDRGSPVVNEVGVTLDPSVAMSQGDVDAIAEQAWNAWVGNVLVELSTHVKLVTVRVTALDSATAPQKEYVDPGGPVSGGSGGSPLPFQVSLCVSEYSDTRGRSGRGRMYLGLIGEGALGTDGLWTDAKTAAVLTAMEGFKSNMEALLPLPIKSLCVLSRRHHAFHKIDHYLVRPIPRTQRRREIS